MLADNIIMKNRNVLSGVASLVVALWSVGAVMPSLDVMAMIKAFLEGLGPLGTVLEVVMAVVFAMVAFYRLGKNN